MVLGLVLEQPRAQLEGQLARPTHEAAASQGVAEVPLMLARFVGRVPWDAITIPSSMIRVNSTVELIIANHLPYCGGFLLVFLMRNPVYGERGNQVFHKICVCVRRALSVGAHILKNY